MEKNKKLPIIAVDNTAQKPNVNSSSTKIEIQATFERRWHQDPEQFNPMKNCLGRNRIDLTFELIQKHLPLQDKKVADLGCGKGVLTQMLSKAGASVDAVDIAAQPLKAIQTVNDPKISTFQDYVPHTKLQDFQYDLVLSTELIAELPRPEYRLYMSEMSRLMKQEGIMVCSTPLDVYSVDPYERFVELVFTEFEPSEWVVSHHAFYIKLLDFFKAPERFNRGSKESHFRQKLLQQRRGLKSLWFKFNSTRIMGYFWWPISKLLIPLIKGYEQWNWGLIFFEKWCKKLAPATTLSHVIVIGKKRSLFSQTEPVPPLERIQKQRIWE